MGTTVRLKTPSPSHRCATGPFLSPRGEENNFTRLHRSPEDGTIP